MDVLINTTKGDKMSNNTHDSIMAAIQTYSEENSKFTEKGIKASATRARKALAELGKLIKARRKEIQETKNAEKNAA
jgi:N-glycosylase/DNA lyase